MDTFGLIAGLLGGVGLFLLGMGLMTDGLKAAAGPALERILVRLTQTRMRGLASGVLVTALVQSSSAVTVAAIGFVNAGLLNLSQAVWVLFGANVGTTMTGWLVALVGLKFKIEALALPLIGVGMVLRLSGEGSRRGAAGIALAGFGALFLGIDMLKETFSGLSADFQLPAGDGVLDILLQVGIGIVLTVLMQSSSASLALALTAAQGGLLSAQGAAAVVIGANIGTTVTALIAALGATPNAKRAAAAHILFNVLTGIVALLVLPWLIGALGVMREWLGIDSAPAATLALFHTVFNVLGVLLIWPIAAHMTRFLEARFKSAEEDEGRPRYLDKTVLAVPALALGALECEVRRVGEIAVATVAAAAQANSAPMTREKSIVLRLNQAIADFVVQLHRAGMSPESARRLPEILRLARYYETATDAAAEAVSAGAKGEVNLPEAHDFRLAAQGLLDQCRAAAAQTAAESLAAARTAMEGSYQQLKARLLEAGASEHLAVTTMDAHLRAASALHRALEQVAKAASMCIGPKPPNMFTNPQVGAGETTM